MGAVQHSLSIDWGSAPDPGRRRTIVQTCSSPTQCAHNHDPLSGCFSAGMHGASASPCSGNTMDRAAMR